MIELPLMMAAVLMLVAWPEDRGDSLCPQALEPADGRAVELHGDAAK